MASILALARRYRASVKALPPPAPKLPAYPAQSAYSHGRTLAGCGYTLAQAMAIHSRADNYDPTAMLRGYNDFLRGS